MFSGDILPCMLDNATRNQYHGKTMEPIQIAMIFALIISVVIHEMAHVYAAEWLGDPTARLSGRLSPNPLVHLDPLMSVIIPGLLVVTGAPFLFGAAKPVPYNPYNFRNQKWGEAIVAVAGPVSNLVIALIFAGLIRFADVLSLSATFVQLSFGVVVLNIFLAFFNLVPIPPLDGSKILPRFLPLGVRMQYDRLRMVLERNAFLGFAIIIFVFFYILAAPMYAAVQSLAFFLVGG